MLLTGKYDGTTMSLYNQGTLNNSASKTGNIDYGDSSAKDLCIGMRSRYSPGEYSQEDIAELIIYNRALTSAEQLQAEVYLADKYGLYDPNATWLLAYSGAVLSEITRNQWDKAQAAAYAAFLATNPPVPPTGLVTWLKADTGTTVDTSNNLTTWATRVYAEIMRCKPRAGIDRRSLPIKSMASRSCGLMGSTSFMTVPDNASLDCSNITMLAVYQVPNASTATWIMSKPYASSGAWGDPFLSYGLGTGLSSGIQGLHVTTSGTRTQIESSLTLQVNTATLSTGMYDGTTMSLYNQGTPITSTSKTGNIDYGDSSAKDLCIGMHSSYSAGEYSQIDIAELLIYNRALTSAEQLQAEIYLANKYGLAYLTTAPTITPNGGSFSSSTPVSISSAPSPAVIRYTLDGTPPTASSPQYTGSFTLTQSAPVNCAIFLSNLQVSPVATAQFYIGDSGSIGISDAWQMTYFGHTGISPSALSPGGSGLTNLQAYLYGYNPTLYSTNGDGAIRFG